MKVLIISGFLGSGKTSVLLQLARYIVRNSDKTNRVAIIENEIGDVGIDDKVLRSAGYVVKEIFAGCVCCGLTGNLIAAVQNIQNSMDPEWLIIEATGVACPSNIVDALWHNLRVNAKVVTIIDASRWKRIYLALKQLIEGQLVGAQIALINKSDLVDDKELDMIEEQVISHNAVTQLYRICGTKEIDTDILRAVLNGNITGISAFIETPEVSYQD